MLIKLNKHTRGSEHRQLSILHAMMISRCDATQGRLDNILDTKIFLVIMDNVITLSEIYLHSNFAIVSTLKDEFFNLRCNRPSFRN